MTTHTETQVMCERLRELAQTTVRISEWASRGHPETAIRIEDVLEWQAAALLTRQQGALDWEKAHSAEAAKEVECLLLEIERLTLSERQFIRLISTVRAMRKGMDGHHVNAEDLYALDTTLEILASGEAKP